MRTHRNNVLVGVAAVLAAGSLAACSSSKSTAAPASGSTTSGAAATSAPAASKAYVGVILPDSASSDRWETQDRPALTAAFQAKGVKFDIQNAQGDKQKFGTIADQMIGEGVNVLVIVDLDSGSGSAVLQKAKAAGIATIDYDRLTLGGGADYYVSFDNVKVGNLQGQGLADCLKADGATNPVVAEVNGSPTDNNATLFAQGYNSILDPLYAAGTLKKGPNQSIANWDNPTAGTTFETMLASTPNIGGVLVANDGMAQAVIAILQKNHLNGKVPVTGQDATIPGLQSILSGDQCMSVFKDSKKEAGAAAELAIDLATGNKADAASVATASVTDSQTNAKVASVLLTPEAITKATVEDVVKAGAVTAAQICTANYAAACSANGVS
jgi:D-xylose transport system substrate-binding protein